MVIETNVALANRIRGIAAEKHRSHVSLASEIGISPMAMSRRLSGRTSFTPDELIRLADALDATVDEFFTLRLKAS